MAVYNKDAVRITETVRLSFSRKIEEGGVVSRLKKWGKW